jgi:chorismate dehydratase
MSKLKISVVSYFNALPFRYALQHDKRAADWELHFDIPSVCADKLMNGTVDIGLIPIAELAQLSGAKVLSNYCIAADGEVQSVLLLSEVPLQEIGTIMLDYQSRTSVKLCRLLATKFWNIDPKWESTKEGYETYIKGDKAGVVIGDRALELRSQYKYVYDLSGEWKKFTGGLPFVFACWVAIKKISDSDITLFNDILKSGIDDRLNILDRESVSDKGKREYILNTIQYRKTGDHEKAMKLFLDSL